MRSHVRAFTLIELLVALAILATLLSIVAPRYFSSVSRADEAALRQDLFVLRDALDKHFADTGKYPESLADLVTKRYIRSIPVDPITKSDATWTIIAPEDPAKGGVRDVRSGATSVSRDGKPFAEW